MNTLIGREAQQAVLGQIIESRVPELAVVTGRLDVGKTTLVRRCLGDRLCIHLTGEPNSTLAQQLGNFTTAITAARGESVQSPTPASWAAAFQQLIHFLESLGNEQKQVVFLDELPWLASRRSQFLPAFAQFWNGWASQQPQAAVVVSGSAGAWIQERLLAARAAWSNRVTRQIHLCPLSLGETHDYLAQRGVKWSRLETLDLYLALGGVPRYLNEVRPGRTAAQSIDDICFSPAGLLNDEFHRLYRALFEHPERRLKIVQAMTDRRCALNRDELRQAAEVATGGNLTVMLEELLGAELVDRTIPWRRASKDAVYRLADEYSLFYLMWIERNRTTGKNIWTRKLENPSWRGWCDYAFENVCLKHADQLMRALELDPQDWKLCSWRHRTVRKSGTENDIGLVLHSQQRRIHLVQTRYCLNELLIDKNYAAQLRGKREAFRRGTQTKKTLTMALVSTHPVKRNRHSESLIDIELDLDALYRRQDATD